MRVAGIRQPSRPTVEKIVIPSIPRPCCIKSSRIESESEVLGDRRGNPVLRRTLRRIRADRCLIRPAPFLGPPLPLGCLVKSAIRVGNTKKIPLKVTTVVINGDFETDG